MRLLRAAEAVFGQHGYDGASIAEICRRADTALGSFYVYFPDKRAAFIELIDSLSARLRKQLAAAVVGLDDRLAIERAGLRAFFAFAGKHRRLYRIVRQAEFVDEPTFRRYYQRLAKGYTAALAGAMERGELRALDPAVVAYCLMGIADFLGMRWVLWGSDAEIEHVVDSAMDLLAGGIAPRPGAAPRRASKTSKASKADEARGGERRDPRGPRRTKTAKRASAAATVTGDGASKAKAKAARGAATSGRAARSEGRRAHR